MANSIRLGGGGSGGSATLITKSITQNGTYLAQDDNADGYSEVSVDVAGGIDYNLLYSLNQSQGGQWFNTNIDTTQYDKLLFINSVNGEDGYMREIAISDIIVVNSGTSDTYTEIFSTGAIGRMFICHIYNNELWVGYNASGSSGNVVGVYEEVNSSVEFKNYLKFNGYGIILPWTLNSDYKIEVVFHETTYLRDSAIIGNTRNETRSNLTEYNNAYFTSIGTSGQGFGTWSAGEHTFITNNGNGKNEFDGVEVTDYTPTTDSTINYAIGWRATAGNAFKGWIKSYKVYSISSGDLLHDLKPALVMDSPCLYDTIDGKIYSTSLVEAVDTIT